MNKRRSLITGAIASLLGGLALIAPGITHAEGWFDLSNIGFTVFQYGSYYISYIIAIIGYIIFAIEVFFLQFILDLNFTIVNSTSVQFGFSIVLAFANILFVAAVIIMAVSTIIRYDTYGAKQLLWKIVIAAIGVNFSLILAGTVINFADQGTKFFMDNAVPNPTSDTGATVIESGGKGTGFVDNLAGAFNPQRAMLVSGVTPDKKDASQVAAAIQTVNKEIGGIYAAIVGVFLAAGMVILTVIFFAVLIAAFLTRFIMLSLLLTIMPVVWLCWIFPFGRGVVSWWRNYFIKWTFFAPMAMFFLYLSMKSIAFLNSAHIVSGIGSASLGSTVGATKGVSGFLAKSLGDFTVPLMQNVLSFALVAGTLYGGLYFSSKLGIKAAGAGAKAFESLGNSVKRRAVNTARDRGLGAWDRVRTAGKDKHGNSAVQRFGTRLNSIGNSRAMNAPVIKQLAQLTGIKGSIEAAGSAIAKVGVADNKKEREERAARVKERDKGLTGGQVRSNFERGLSGTLRPTAAEERGQFENMVDKKMAGDLHKYAWIDKDDHSKGENAAKAAQLRKFMQRAEDAGFSDIVTKANPLMAQYSTPKPKKEGDRNPTKSEMVHNAIKGMKSEDLVEMANKNADLFGNADGSDPSANQVYAVKALGNRINKIEDPETLVRIMNTLEWVYTHKENKGHKLNKAFVSVMDPGIHSDDTTAYGFEEKDYAILRPVLKALDRNVNISGILKDVAEGKDGGGGKKEKKEKKKKSATWDTEGRAAREEAKKEKAEKKERKKAEKAAAEESAPEGDTPKE